MVDWKLSGGQYLNETTVRRNVGDTSLCVVPVRLFDDDGELYLTGRVSERTINGNESVAFRLLDAAAADLGCTRMDFYMDRAWKTL